MLLRLAPPESLKGESRSTRKASRTHDDRHANQWDRTRASSTASRHPIGDKPKLNHLHHLLTIILLAFAIPAAGCRKQTSSGLPPSNIKTDEDILFFPTYGRYDDEAGVWRFDVHGKVFEPEESSTKRAASTALLRASADVSVDTEDSVFLDARIKPFLVDNERGKSVTIKVAGEQFKAGTSEANGHFSSSLVLNADGLEVTENEIQILETQAVLGVGDSRAFAGRIHLIPSHGVSVISDIDDTIKHSQVTDRSELLQNTFLREFRAVEGMPELYKGLADFNVAFHYVSGSPWQLYQPIDAFMAVTGFPNGTFHLKQFRLTDSSAFDLLSSQQETKLAAITPLLDGFPQRVFILIGDSGEQDPEIYGRIARERSNQIVGVFIRNVTNEKSSDERFANAFENVTRDRWALFDDVSQVAQQINSLAKTKQ